MFKLKIYVQYYTKNPSNEKKTLEDGLSWASFVEVALPNIFSCGTCTSDNANILETE